MRVNHREVTFSTPEKDKVSPIVKIAYETNWSLFIFY